MFLNLSPGGFKIQDYLNCTVASAVILNEVFFYNIKTDDTYFF